MLRRPRITGAALVAGLFLASGCLLPIPDRHGQHALERQQMLVGAWLGSWPSDANPAVDRFQDETGIRLDMVDVYMDWYTPFANVSHTLRHIAARGAIPSITWEPMGLTTQDIVTGTRRIGQRDGTQPTVDEYLAGFAAGVCSVAQGTGQPVLVRTLHEMNGFWFSWGTTFRDSEGRHPNDPGSYRAAFAKVHDAFTSRCGHDVRFVWAINHFNGDGAAFTDTFPGDDYVDYLGIDGYNWGTRARWGWQGFDTIFLPGYCALVALPSTRPVLIAETASGETGGSKSAWIRDLYAKLPHYDRVRGFVWFNDAKYEIEIKGDMDWPVASSASSAAAYAEGARAILDRRASGSPIAASTPVACPAGTSPQS